MTDPFRSPFEPALKGRGGVFGEVAGASAALHFGDIARETAAFREGAGVIDRSWRGIVEASGRDRVRFLHGMCTNDIKSLKPGEGCMAVVVNRQGKMVAEIIVRAAENVLLLELDRTAIAPTLEALGKFMVADDVTFATSDAEVVGIYGPGAEALLQPPSLKDFHGAMRGDVMVSRNGFLGAGGYDLLIPGGKTEELDRILGHGGTPAGFEAYETVRIESGFPRWGADMDDTVLPMEAGLDPIAISYTKGCYIGQEVIQRVKTYSEPPRMLVSLGIEGIVAASPGAAISRDGQEIGRVTSAAAGTALGYVRREHRAEGVEVSIHPGITAVVRPLPWHARIASV